MHSRSATLRVLRYPHLSCCAALKFALTIEAMKHLVWNCPLAGFVAAHPYEVHDKNGFCARFQSEKAAVIHAAFSGYEGCAPGIPAQKPRFGHVIGPDGVISMEECRRRAAMLTHRP